MNSLEKLRERRSWCPRKAAVAVAMATSQAFIVIADPHLVTRLMTGTYLLASVRVAGFEVLSDRGPQQVRGARSSAPPGDARE